MKTYCNIYVDDEKKGTCGNYDEALRWVKENYSHILPYLTWEPKGAGGVDRWDNEVNSIMIEKYYPDGIDLHYIIQQHRKEKKIYDEKEEIEEQIDQEEKRKLPLTPRRTTLKMKKKNLTIEKEGVVKEAEDGKKYISKLKPSGKLYWAAYTEKTYKGAPVKASKITRKCPQKPAKEFETGTVRKGLDGQSWSVKMTKTGVKKWVRKM